MGGAREQMNAARRAAERKLERALKPLEQTEDVLACVAAFAKFLRALFRSVKDKLLAAIDWEAAWLAGEAASTERFDAVLEALLAHTIEEGLSEATLAAQRASGAAGASSPTPRPQVALRTTRRAAEIQRSQRQQIGKRSRVEWSRSRGENSFFALFCV
jgi:hypothetical protein